MLLPHAIRSPGTTEVRKVTADSRFFDAILDLRRSRSPESLATDAADERADHYLLQVDGLPLAAIRVQQARRGPLDCEAHYPRRFLAAWRQVAGSSSRLLRRGDSKACPSLLRQFFAAVWRDQFEDGMRVDLINAHLPMASYYDALGYDRLPGSEFVHPRLGTASIVMFLVADQLAPAQLRQSFENPALLGDLRRDLLMPSQDLATG